MIRPTFAFYVHLYAPIAGPIEDCKPRINDTGVMRALGQNLMTVDALVCVQSATEHNTICRRYNSGVGRWIKSSSWEVTYTTYRETGERVYA